MAYRSPRARKLALIGRTRVLWQTPMWRRLVAMVEERQRREMLNRHAPDAD